MRNKVHRPVGACITSERFVLTEEFVGEENSLNSEHFLVQRVENGTVWEVLATTTRPLAYQRPSRARSDKRNLGPHGDVASYAVRGPTGSTGLTGTKQ